MNRLIWIELSRSAFRHNIATITRIIGRDVVFAAAVKSNAYGHGLVETARACAENGSNWLCVNAVDEAVRIREAGITLPILIMGYVAAEDISPILMHDFRIFIYDLAIARSVGAEAHRLGMTAKVHIKVDTGMHRQGVPAIEFDPFRKELERISGIEIEGMATHFSASDDLKHPEFFKKQLQVFASLPITKDIMRHCANSAAALVYPETHMDMVRIGISLYGLYASPAVQEFCVNAHTELKPVLSLKTRIVQIKKVRKGSRVSYGSGFTAKTDMTVAILPIGYYDGLPRTLSNRGAVLVRGSRARIVGRICMNITIVDISWIHRAAVGDEVVILGTQGDEEISADEIAGLLDTINYEVVTRLRETIDRCMID